MRDRPEHLGAVPLSDGRTRFRVWAPKSERVELVREHGPRTAMHPAEHGYFELVADDMPTGARYRFSLEGDDPLPDPASRSQPEGVHGPSQVVSREFEWKAEQWIGLPLHRYVIYELHVGTFTPEGTFDAAISKLDELRALGITAIELMPIAQFPGSRNWGYDGVCPYATQSSYGGPDGLRRLVDACHARGLAVVLDVVYNHLGPEGNYLDTFGPYFTDRYNTPWGRALNFDGPGSDEVRRFFIGSALWWLDACRVDALRLDAIHAIVDPSPVPFIQELTETVHRRAEALGRRIHLIAESAANDARLITPVDAGGYGADAQWNDDFHHSLRTLLTGDRSGYYASYGEVEHLRRAFVHGYTYTGERSAFHGRRHGSRTDGLPPHRFVVFAQNHDHVGNRMKGERLGDLVSHDKLRLAAAAVVLSPFIPLLFMGEEYAETAPFLYFISHSDKDLIEAVRKGRKEEFAAFVSEGEAPDPQAEETFNASRLRHDLKREGPHAAMLAYYRELLRLRHAISPVADPESRTLEVRSEHGSGLLTIRRGLDGEETLLALNLGDRAARVEPSGGTWRTLLRSDDPRWSGRESSESAGTLHDDARSIELPPWTAALLHRTTDAKES